MSIANAVVLNSKDHSIADLPAEIIENIFRDVRGRDLIKLTTVCQAFNETIGHSPKLMNKIRLRVDSKQESLAITKLENILKSSERNYCHISLVHAIYGDANAWTSFFTNYPVWKSIKLIRNSFESLGSAETFLKRLSDDLEEIDFDQITPSHFDVNSVLRIKLPRLLKLRCEILPTYGLACTTLKVLNLIDYRYNDHTTLLKSNSDIKDLTVIFDVLQSILKPNLIAIGTQLKLRRFHVDMHNSNNSDNLQTFLRTQAGCLEEVQMEWTEYGKTDPTTSAQALGIIFSEFSKIRKLVVSNKIFTMCSFTTALALVPNFKITELRLRLGNTPEWNEVLEKIVKACPNVKDLFVHKMDSRLLKMCSDELRLVESIFAFSLHVDQLPNDAVKFAHLNSISFCECTIENRPDLKEMKLVDQKAIVMQLLKQED